MTRTILMTAGVVTFAVAAGIALAQKSQTGSKRAEGHSVRTSQGVKKTPPAQSDEGTKTEKGPEADARFRQFIAPAVASLRAAQERFYSGDLNGAEQAAQEAITLSEGLSPLPAEVGRRLIGQIRLRQGQYKEALEWLGADWQTGKDAGLDLDVALCYARLGNYQAARRFYSDQSLLRYSVVKPQDLPGTSSLRSLETSILLARGMDLYFTSSGEELALQNLDAAGKLAPNNGLIAYFSGMSLTHLNRASEAEPYLRKAVQYGHGRVLDMAKEQATIYKQITSAPQQVQ